VWGATRGVERRGIAGSFGALGSRFNDRSQAEGDRLRSYAEVDRETKGKGNMVLQWLRPGKRVREDTGTVSFSFMGRGRKRGVILKWQRENISRKKNEIMVSRKTHSKGESLKKGKEKGLKGLGISAPVSSRGSISKKRDQMNERQSHRSEYAIRTSQA